MLRAMPDRVIARRALALALARARRLCLASDFDGTLARIVNHPDRARLSSRARRALRRLAETPGVRLALISGRSLADLEPRIGLRGLYLAGLAGIETRDGRGRRRKKRVAGLPRPLLAELERWCARFAGAWIERKGPVVSIHYRALPRARRPAFVRGLKQRAAPYRDRVELQPGKMVLELRPRGAPDKAAALLTWLGPRARTNHRPETALVFLGDDENDEEAHALVQRLKGIAVAVGRHRSRARFKLKSPARAVELLEWLSRAWQAKAQAKADGAAGLPTARRRRSASPPPRSLRPAARNASAPRAAARS
jgi:trehalose 6-phosphate phosphatase